MLRAIFPCFARSAFFQLFFLTEKKNLRNKTIDGCLRALTLYVKTIFKQVYTTFLTNRKALSLATLTVALHDSVNMRKGLPLNFKEL